MSRMHTAVFNKDEVKHYRRARIAVARVPMHYFWRGQDSCFIDTAQLSKIEQPAYAWITRIGPEIAFTTEEKAPEFVKNRQCTLKIDASRTLEGVILAAEASGDGHTRTFTITPRYSY